MIAVEISVYLQISFYSMDNGLIFIVDICVMYNYYKKPRKKKMKISFTFKKIQNWTRYLIYLANRNRFFLHELVNHSIKMMTNF